jgi:hypothetical protein
MIGGMQEETSTKYYPPKIRPFVTWLSRSENPADNALYDWLNSLDKREINQVNQLWKLRDNKTIGEFRSMLMEMTGYESDKPKEAKRRGGDSAQNIEWNRMLENIQSGTRLPDRLSGDETAKIFKKAWEREGMGPPLTNEQIAQNSVHLKQMWIECSACLGVGNNRYESPEFIELVSRFSRDIFGQPQQAQQAQAQQAQQAKPTEDESTHISNELSNVRTLRSVHPRIFTGVPLFQYYGSCWFDTIFHCITNPHTGFDHIMREILEKCDKNTRTVLSDILEVHVRSFPGINIKISQKTHEALHKAYESIFGTGTKGSLTDGGLYYIFFNQIAKRYREDGDHGTWFNTNVYQKIKDNCSTRVPPLPEHFIWNNEGTPLKDSGDPYPTIGGGYLPIRVRLTTLGLDHGHTIKSLVTQVVGKSARAEDSSPHRIIGLTMSGVQDSDSNFNLENLDRYYVYPDEELYREDGYFLSYMAVLVGEIESKKVGHVWGLCPYPDEPGLWTIFDNEIRLQQHGSLRDLINSSHKKYLGDTVLDFDLSYILTYTKSQGQSAVAMPADPPSGPPQVAMPADPPSGLPQVAMTADPADPPSGLPQVAMTADPPSGLPQVAMTPPVAMTDDPGAGDTRVGAPPVAMTDDSADDDPNDFFRQSLLGQSQGMDPGYSDPVPQDYPLSHASHGLGLGDGDDPNDFFRQSLLGQSQGMDPGLSTFGSTGLDLEDW